MPKYTAGFNQPGYLPDSDPYEFDDFGEAQDYIIDELENAADIASNADDPDAEAECEAAKEEADQWRAEDGKHWNTYADGYAYWIMKENDS